MVRLQARRIAQAYQGAGRTIPPGVAAILKGDTEAAFDRDTEAYRLWCESRGVECIQVLGVSNFRKVPAGNPARN